MLKICQRKDQFVGFFFKLTHICLILQVKVQQPKEAVPGKEVSTKTRRLHLAKGFNPRHGTLVSFYNMVIHFAIGNAH